MHLCINKLTIIGSENGLWNWPATSLWTLRNKLQWNLNWNSYVFIKKMHLKLLSEKWRPFSLSLNVLVQLFITITLIVGPAGLQPDAIPIGTAINRKQSLPVQVMWCLKNMSTILNKVSKSAKMSSLASQCLMLLSSNSGLVYQGYVGLHSCTIRALIQYKDVVLPV